MRSTRLFAFAAVTLLLIACGGAESAAPPASPARGPTSNPASETAAPTTVQEAQDQIAQAKADLASESRKKTEAPAAPPPPAEPAPTTPSASGAPDQPKPSSGQGSMACQTPCRAITSMRRAVDTLCHLTGNDDNRCVDAKRTLKESEARIVGCGC